ncbi:tetratricopeptide repeat protein [Streptomyces ipomoeae]|uniref:Tetratricopeptide repeat protein n=1 Tax=Streptomyces ipomoeae 91-03 TaxID=698759 RepID=L1L529_9ACTN|nr:tetratricopeptide repeat protein [Streptomyces ipomoeae]EKX67894.1 tetratricopeptide repeat protein [Streptomyces ipomoeae 91-03]MDX2696733.1 tetratricopeptide repeat protein [Streptomyces ipomoeae]MDX2839762.1 tetratricopeptide repeat protein [Streptomyces ipomoeae]
MQQGQVVQIRTPRFGSGYLIAPRLVLTAEHLLPPEDAEGEPGEITVAFPGSEVRTPARVRWRRRDGIVDAALLEIPADAPGWTVPESLGGARGRSPQRWGRFVTSGSDIPVAAHGFPRQQKRRDGRGAEELVFRVRRLGGARFEIVDDMGQLNPDLSGLDDETAANTTAWSGMSGAAVFPEGEDLLLGVVRKDRRARHGTRLTVTSSADLLDCADFREVLREATSIDPQPEPAGFVRLLKAAPPRRDLTSPTMLLRADAEVVSFHGREDTLAELERWCLTDADGLPSVRVLTAQGGQGKTRLARRLMARLRDLGWVAGEVRDEPGGLHRLRTLQHPLLLVVDYAESRPELVRRLWEQAEEVRHPVRLLLLARSLGSWQTRAIGDLRDSEIRLHTLSPGPAEREQAFRTAARDLSRRLAEATDDKDVDWPGLAGSLPVTGYANGGRGTETALTVQMAALATLLRRGRTPERPGVPLEAELLKHEEKYWRDTARGWGMGPREQGLLKRAVAAAVLCPARDEDQAHATLSRLLPGASSELIADIAVWLRDLYPPAEDRRWGQLEPDRLAEYQASEQIIDDPGLLGRLFARAPDHQRVQTLTVLARSAVAHANEGRAERAYRVVDRLREALRSVPAEVPLTADMLRRHSGTLPEQSHVLRDYALDVARELSRLYRDTADDRPQAYHDRAWALHNLAVRHLAVGDWEEAREAAGEAVAIGAHVVDAGAATHRAERGDSLLALSRALRMTGRLREAYDAGEQALRLFRELTEDGGEESEKHERGLVRALINQSEVVWRLDPSAIPFDTIERSDEHTAEAVRHARRLVTRRPDLDPLLLPKALTARGATLWRFRRHTEALSLSEEAVEATRRLAGENPDAYTADLANALKGLHVDYSNTSRPRAEVLPLVEEAVKLIRPLADDLPRVHLPDLAQLVHNLAWDQFDAGDHSTAWESLGEALRHRRALARDPCGLGAPELARSVSTLATFRATTGDHQAAVEGYTEALEIYAHAKLPLSMSQLRNQSQTSQDLALSYEALGRPQEALAAQNQALDILRRLSEYGPDFYAEGYATALHDFSYLYRRHDRRVAERIQLRQALQLYRRLPLVTAQERKNLAFCLQDLGSSYASSWATADRAVPLLREAYELHMELSADDPAHEVYVADTCMDLARALLETSGYPEAVRVAEHEVRIRRRLLDENRRDRTERNLCYALLRLANGRAMAGRTAAAWRTALEAEKACLALAENADAQPDPTAWLLMRLAETLSLCGRHDCRRAARALEPARRAIRLHRRLVDQDPSKQANLRWAAATLAKVLERVGRHPEAIEVRLRRGA